MPGTGDVLRHDTQAVIEPLKDGATVISGQHSGHTPEEHLRVRSILLLKYPPQFSIEILAI